MTLSRWMAFIAVVVVVGMIKVSQQTAIWLKAYGLGRQAAAFHELENDTQRLAAHLVALQSPAHLGAALQDRKVKLVAWTTLAETPPLVQLAQYIERTGAKPRSDARQNLVR